jgi:hypothetical protein
VGRRATNSADHRDAVNRHVRGHVRFDRLVLSRVSPRR